MLSPEQFRWVLDHLVETGLIKLGRMQTISFTREGRALAALAYPKPSKKGKP